MNNTQVYGITHKQVAALISSSTSPVSVLFHRLYQGSGDKSITKDESWSDLAHVHVTEDEVASMAQLRPITEEVAIS